MDSRNLAVGIMLLSQSTVGILGNVSLLSSYVIRCYNKWTLKPTDLILTHLFIANFFTILSRGVPRTMVAFGLKQFLGDFDCKLVFYIQKVSRSMSISTTCLLSVFQAITISSEYSCWMNLKVKAPKLIRHSLFLFWVLHMLVNMIFPVYTHSRWNSKSKTEKNNYEFCSIEVHDEIADVLCAALWVFPEVLFSMIMAWASSSMVVILYRHKQRVQNIRSSHVSHRMSPESRAIHSILVLVFTFLSFYTLSSILQGYMALSYNRSWWLMNIVSMMSLCFPTLGPFLMSHQLTVPRFFFSCLRKAKFKDLVTGT